MYQQARLFDLEFGDREAVASEQPELDCMRRGIQQQYFEEGVS
jgi:hypothetical protein